VGFKRAGNTEKCGGCRIAALRRDPEPTFPQTYTRRTTLALKRRVSRTDRNYGEYKKQRSKILWIEGKVHVRLAEPNSKNLENLRLRGTKMVLKPRAWR
jgi:hypothetical protein